MATSMNVRGGHALFLEKVNFNIVYRPSSIFVLPYSTVIVIVIVIGLYRRRHLERFNDGCMMDRISLSYKQPEPMRVYIH